MLYCTTVYWESIVFSDVSSGVDVATFRQEHSIVPGTITVKSQCNAVVRSHTNGFPKCRVGYVISDVKTTGKYWLNCIFSSSWVKTSQGLMAAAAADSPRDVWWTLSGNNTVFSFYNITRTGPWFNIKMTCYQYRKSHCGDKTVVRSPYLHNGISYTGKMTSSYWIRALVWVVC